MEGFVLHTQHDLFRRAHSTSQTNLMDVTNIILHHRLRTETLKKIKSIPRGIARATAKQLEREKNYTNKLQRTEEIKLPNAVSPFLSET